MFLVQKAWGLLTKGHNNTNDCFVTIALGKVKYQTSVKLKSGQTVEWHEECELPIPDQGNTAEIILTVLHRNFLGVDEFLGRINIPLANFDVYERPRNRWYPLESKPGKENKKERGELEAKIAFTVKAGSLTDLSKKDKHKSSIGQLSHVAQSVGGSLMSIGSLEKRKGLRKFAKSIGSKMNLKGKGKKGDTDNESLSGSVSSLKRRVGTLDNSLKNSKQVIGDSDPGVVSEDEDDFHLDELSHNSSASSLNTTGTPVPNAVGSLENLAGGEVLRRHTVAAPPKKPPRLDSKSVDEWEVKLYGKSGKGGGGLHINASDTLNRRSWEASKLSSQIEEEEPTEKSQDDTLQVESPKSDVKSKSPAVNKKYDEKEGGMFSKLKYFRKDKNLDEVKHEKPEDNERIIIGGETDTNTIMSNNSRLSNEILQKFNSKTREDLILMVCEQQEDLAGQKKKLKDLEDYLDDLLLRVMETTPRILQNPYVSCKLAHTKLSN
ncbi:Rab11 interacting protein [Carabus blaptoides fortunei]